MKTEEVKLKRYYPSEGKALKITEFRYNYTTHKFEDSVRYTDEQGCIIDENILTAPVEEVPMEEFKEWHNQHCFLSFTRIGR